MDMEEMEHILAALEKILQGREYDRVQAINRGPWRPLVLDSPQGLAPIIDHTLLAPNATTVDIKRICLEARTWQTYAVCVNPRHVSLAREMLAGSTVKVATVVGFPLGATGSDVKAFETLWAVRTGADEIDMVIDRGAVAEGYWRAVLDDIYAVRDAAPHPTLLKVILETASLSHEQKIMAALLSVAAGADFVKTSTGFDQGGATIDDVRLLRHVVGRNIGVKASGGIRTLQDARDMVAAGADRLGVSRTSALIGK